MRQLFVFLAVFLVGCAPTLLEQHVRAADALRTTNESAVEAIRRACPPEIASDGCEVVRNDQHAFADAHAAWVQAMQGDRQDDQWNSPTDRAALTAVAASYTKLADDAQHYLGVTLDPPPESFRALASGAP